MDKIVAAKLKRKQILTLFKEMRSSCPDSNSVCSSVRLRRTSERGDAEQEEFELHLKWVPDQPSRNFLKEFTVTHNLGLNEQGKSLTVYNPAEQRP
jgi:hypothetical protein